MTVQNFFRRLLPLGLLCLALAWASAPAGAQTAPGVSAVLAQMPPGVTTTYPPPPLPVYSEPPLPADGYVFIPGYWAWAGNGYYWVPGTWVQPPPGLLWTPGYWALADDGVTYVWQPGYWGPSVGFYGGINYGFGYYGTGYDGGYWNSGFFFYNIRVHNFGHVRVAHSFTRPVPAIRSTRVGFTGAPHGVDARPGPSEEAASHEQHAPAIDLQVQHETRAATIRSAPVTVNHGRPPVAATPQPGTFTGHGIVAARSFTAHPPASHPSSPPPQSQNQNHSPPPNNHGGDDQRDHH